MKKWSAEQRAKFKATMAAKGKKKFREPNYVPEVPVTKRQIQRLGLTHAPTMVIEVKAGSEATFVVGGARVTVRAIK
jgi:hypothetical protein